LTGQLPLRGTLNALLPLTFFVGNDTAVRHAAMSLNVPTLGLFGPTSALKWGNEAPPLHRIMTAQSGNMDDIAVKDVVKEVENFLASSVKLTL
jgi:ADP-heptose:LPS heptosyltransferase